MNELNYLARDNGDSPTITRDKVILKGRRAPCKRWRPCLGGVWLCRCLLVLALKHLEVQNTGKKKEIGKVEDLLTLRGSGQFIAFPLIGYAAEYIII